MTREEAKTIILKHQFAFASMPDDVIEALNYLVKEEPRWIPVSERLPELEVEVLVTDDAGGLATISTDSIYEIETGEKGWYTSQRVTAWMPLPEPYREVEE